LIWVLALSQDVLDFLDVDQLVSDVHVIKNDLLLFTSQVIRCPDVLFSTGVVGEILGIFGNQLLQGFEDLFTLLCSEIDLSIGMQTVSDGSLLLKTFDNMVKVLVVSGWSWALERMFLSIGEWIEVQFVLDQGVIHELGLVGIAQTTVPIVDNVASVHNLTENVSEIFPWDITRLEFVDVLVQNNGRVSQVTQREIVTEVPSFLSKSLSLDNAGMEVAQGEEDTLQLDILVIELIDIWEVTKSSLHVGS
jgi:hypothetical protein